MSIRYGLLALLAEQPRHGYELRAEFENRTGTTWPLNVGQVYTTLSRLERDGMVAVSDGSDESHTVYELTAAGDVELRSWLETPVAREDRPRDELAIKLALAARLEDVNLSEVVQTQRRVTLESLQGYNRQLRAIPADDLEWSMVLDSLIFAADAELRWLDACEQRLMTRKRVAKATSKTESRNIEQGAHR